MVRPSLLVLAGAIGTAELHAHHTVQVLVGRGGEVALGDGFGHEVVCRAAVIPPNVPHAVVRGTADGLLVHFDPESVAGAVLSGIPRPRDAAAGWVGAAEELGLDTESTWLCGAGASSETIAGEWFRDDDGADPSRVQDRVRAWVRATLALGPDAWLHDASPSESPDGTGHSVTARLHPAVAHVLRTVPARLDNGSIRLHDLAREVHLSESRLTHVFSAELGLPFRAYVRWLRVQRAVELLAAGHSLTEVAHRAGFADSAHLTRVCRRMFGAPPSLFSGIRWETDLPPNVSARS